jgi:hypothetical protein
MSVGSYHRSRTRGIRCHYYHLSLWVESKCLLWLERQKQLHGLISTYEQCWSFVWGLLLHKSSSYSISVTVTHDNCVIVYLSRVTQDIIAHLRDY